jgi:dihydrofolate synthase/folylpolyglutamate synthase
LNYEDAMSYISSLAPRGWRLGLDRMEEFARRAELFDSIGEAGGPQFIHVAGTNGKGSTTAFVQSLLIEHGYRTGAFFSPFVVDPRERIQLDRHLISKNAVARLTTHLKPIAESLSDTDFGGVTEFEFKAALGFLLWKRKGCDWVALEVGLGGRLDATNIVTPRASIITSISLDHTAILGDTISAIAFEKAGIIKPGVPVVIGSLPADAVRVIEVIAAERNSPLIRAKEFPIHSELGIGGDMQPTNFNMACTALEAAGIQLNQDAIERAASRATIPGRFQIEQFQGKTIVLDGAHNIESAEGLARTLRARFPGRAVVLVTNLLSGHDAEGFFAPLLPLCEEVVVVPIDSPRSRTPEQTATLLRSLGGNPVVEERLASGLTTATQLARGDLIVVVTGSYYLVGDVLRLLSESRNRE